MSHQDKLTQEKDEFVESLGLTQEKIREDLEKMRDFEGFPIGDVEDIIELSDPPYYTAYPNPYIKDFINKLGVPYDEQSDDYHAEPFSSDISEGKNETVYLIHSYHTKVPPKAIESFILHYTKIGDIVLDFFGGTGMTGVASKRLNRNSILVDISPAATFIGSILNNNLLNSSKLIHLIQNILKNVNKELYWLYETEIDNTKKDVSYFVWSDVFICPFCKSEIVYWDVALELVNGKPKNKKKFNCPNCSSELNSRSIERIFDHNGIRKRKCVKKYIKSKNKDSLHDLNIFDRDVLNKIDNYEIPYWYPNYEIPNGIKTQEPLRLGLEYIFQFFTKRNLILISKFRDEIDKIDEKPYKNAIWFLISSIFPVISDRQGYGRGGGGMPGNLYMPAVSSEKNVFDSFERKINKFKKLLNEEENKNLSKNLISTNSATDLSNIPPNSIDYIFVDPPFGSNIMYSELNIIWESWLKIFTNNNNEAIINKSQNKSEDDYHDLMVKSFSSAYNVLKPGRWISVEFHNTKASIWRIIQNSLVKAGFVIAQVAILDKKTHTLNQNYAYGAVNKDLIISAYKPLKAFTESFFKKAGLNMEKDFLEMHLNKLPIDSNVERTQKMLYSKLLAQYIQNGFEVRLDASDFYELLQDNFVERNGFWFIDFQIPKFEKNSKIKEKLKNYDLDQTIIGISDEKTSIIWLANFLKKPKYYDEIFIDFSKNLLTSEDKMPELKTILDENFVMEAGKYRLPSGIERKEREENREKRLIKEFNEIFVEAQSKRKIKEVRKEALLRGLMKLYIEKDVEKIKFLGERLDQNIIDSDDDISAIIDWAMYN